MIGKLLPFRVPPPTNEKEDARALQLTHHWIATANRLLPPPYVTASRVTRDRRERYFDGFEAFRRACECLDSWERGHDELVWRRSERRMMAGEIRRTLAGLHERMGAERGRLGPGLDVPAVPEDFAPLLSVAPANRTTAGRRAAKKA